MIDPADLAHYEAWKFDKVTNENDTSIEAYNREMEALALAYEQACRDIIGKDDQQKLNSFISNNPYRKPGMLGART